MSNINFQPGKAISCTLRDGVPQIGRGRVASGVLSRGKPTTEGFPVNDINTVAMNPTCFVPLSPLDLDSTGNREKRRLLCMGKGPK